MFHISSQPIPRSITIVDPVAYSNVQDINQLSLSSCLKLDLYGLPPTSLFIDFKLVKSLDLNITPRESFLPRVEVTDPTNSLIIVGDCNYRATSSLNASCGELTNDHANQWHEESAEMRNY